MYVLMKFLVSRFESCKVAGNLRRISRESVYFGLDGRDCCLARSDLAAEETERVQDVGFHGAHGRVGWGVLRSAADRALGAGAHNAAHDHVGGGGRRRT